LSQTLKVERPEGEIAGPLADLAGEFPSLFIGSYPFWRQGVFGANIVIRGTDEHQLGAAMSRLAQVFEVEI